MSKGPHGRSSTQSLPFSYVVPSPLTDYLQQVVHYIQWRNTVHLVWNNKIIKSQSPLRSEAHVLPSTKLGSIVISQ